MVSAILAKLDLSTGREAAHHPAAGRIADRI
jgi:hypothetical protein